MDFRDKIVLITGAASGIGEATALLFAKYGAKVSLVDVNGEGLLKIGSACKEAGVEVLLVEANLTTDEGCDKVLKDTVKHFGRVDILINNAGIFSNGSILESKMADFDAIFNLNVRAMYNLTRLISPELVKSKGNIVNVSSVAAHVVRPNMTPYSMSKATVEHFTRLVALELAPKGIRVNAVAPGITITNIYRKLSKYANKDYVKALEESLPYIPLKKLCAPEDIANMVVFLASDQCGLVTGNSVKVDGGIALCGPGANKLMAQNS